MKIFRHEARKVLRLRITRSGDPTKYLTVIDGTKEDMIKLCSALFVGEKTYTKEKVTNIQIRNGHGQKNLESVSYSFYGMGTEDVFNTLIQEIGE